MIALFPSRTIVIEIFGFPVRWYGLMYVAAAILATILLPRLQRHRGLHLSRDVWLDIVTAAMLGVVLGGRLGYVLFYAPDFYLAHPLEILAVWRGGMSSHGGFIGVLIACLILWKRHGVALAALADVVVVPVALGLAFGRIGNFINQELYGTVTDFPFAIAIPGVDGLRHPTQIYAVVKDLLTASVCFLHLRSFRSLHGRTCALFLMLYGTLRFFIEFFREQTVEPFVWGELVLTRGQLLTIPIFVAGLVVWLMAKRK